jgi:hypothetical protein
MELKRASLLLLLPLIFSACDNSQPSYSASNANSAPPPPPAEAAPPPPAPTQPQPVAEAPTPSRVVQDVAPPRPARSAGYNPAVQFAQVPPGQFGPVPKLGVGGCDTYVERYRTCFNGLKATHDVKGPLRRTLAQQLRQWKADVAAGKLSQVASACTDAESKARNEFAKVGCKF